MKVIIVTREPFPYGMAASNRIFCYAKGLIANNIECEIIVVYRTEVFGNKIKNIESYGVYKTVKFRYIGGKTQRNRNIIIRKFDDLFDLIKTYYYCKRNTTKGDIIVNYLKEDKLNELIIRAARKSGAYIIRELCEYPYNAKLKSNHMKVKYELQKVFPRFDGFITISKPLTELALKYKSKKANVIKVPILINNDDFLKFNKTHADIPYLFHAGTMTEKKDAIISTLKAFVIATKQLEIPIKFFLAGPISPDKNEIDKIICENGLNERIVFLGELEHDKVIEYLQSCSLAILNKNDNIQNRNGFSTKLGELLLSETAVITTSIGESNYYLEDGINAYIVEPHNPLLIAEKIVQAFTNIEERNKIAKAGKELAEREFDCIYHGKNLVVFFSSLKKHTLTH